MMCSHSFNKGQCTKCHISEQVCRDAYEQAEAYVIGSAYLTPEQLEERIAKYEKKQRNKKVAETGEGI
jgi:Fe-S-cluster-containing hydrogenase component 2